MDWKEGFIGRVLAAVPAGSWRGRMEAELRDHLDSQCRALAEAGRTQDEARAEALRLMGEPEKLRLEYEAAWRRSPAGRARRAASVLGGAAAGCVVMGALYIFAFVLLGMVGFTYDTWLPDRVCFPILSENRIYVTVFSTVLFLLPFTLGAWLLRFCFRRERRPVGLVTAGLLAAWAGEKAAIIGLSMLIYQMPLGPDLLTRIYDGGDTTAPWFSPVYILLTLVGCILLGQLFGRMDVGEKRRQTA